MNPTRKSPSSVDRDELERFKREINLTEFAAAKGYRIDRRESSRGSVVMRLATNDDKIIIARRGEHWTYFSVRDPADNGTVVDFVQHRTRSNLGEIRKELRAWTGAERPAVPIEDYVPTLSSPERDREAVRKLFDEARADTNSSYLNSRGIRPETLSSHRFRDTFRIDSRGNVLFPHFDREGLSGFESKNYQWTAFSAGGTKALWSSRTGSEDNRLVLTESAIDAISYYQLRPNDRTRYASTAGSWNDHQPDLIQSTIAGMPSESVVVLAFDADDGGDRLATAVEKIAGKARCHRDRPPSKDWNDVLKHTERVYIQSLERARGRGPAL